MEWWEISLGFECIVARDKGELQMASCMLVSTYCKAAKKIYKTTRKDCHIRIYLLCNSYGLDMWFRMYMCFIFCLCGFLWSWQRGSRTLKGRSMTGRETVWWWSHLCNTSLILSLQFKGIARARLSSNKTQQKIAKNGEEAH